jgi:hypothetical protein
MDANYSRNSSNSDSKDAINSSSINASNSSKGGNASQMPTAARMLATSEMPHQQMGC